MKCTLAWQKTFPQECCVSRDAEGDFVLWDNGGAFAALLGASASVKKKEKPGLGMFLLLETEICFYEEQKHTLLSARPSLCSLKNTNHRTFSSMGMKSRFAVREKHFSGGPVRIGSTSLRCGAFCRCGIILRFSSVFHPHSHSNCKNVRFPHTQIIILFYNNSHLVAKDSCYASDLYHSVTYGPSSEQTGINGCVDITQ